MSQPPDSSPSSSSCSSSSSSSSASSWTAPPISAIDEDEDEDEESRARRLEELHRPLLELSRPIKEALERQKEERRLALEKARELRDLDATRKLIGMYVDDEESRVDPLSSEAFTASSFRFFMEGPSCSNPFRDASDIVEHMNGFLFQCASAEVTTTTYFMLNWREDRGVETAVWEPKPLKNLSQLFEGYHIYIGPSGESGTRPPPSLSPLPKGWRCVQVFEYWRKSKARRVIDQKFFHPGKPRGCYSSGEGREKRCYYNTWSGLTFDQETNSDWVTLNPDLSSEILKRIKFHLLAIICRQNKSIYRYIKLWLAHCLQKPGEQTQVVLVISGEQGAGKSVFFTNYLKLFGKHSVVLSKQKDLFDRFGGTLLDDIVMLEVDEIDMSDKKKAEDLKCLIGAQARRREAKFQQVTHNRNWTNFIFTTNNRFCLPLESGLNRRFFHVHADNCKVGDKAYGQQLDEMFNGERRMGLRVLHHWLSNVNLAPRELDPEGKKTEKRVPWDSTPPVTEELRSQILYNASEVEGWWLSILSRGYHITPNETPDSRSKYSWDTQAPEWILHPVCTETLFQLYRNEVKTATVVLKHKFTQHLKILLPDSTHQFKESDSVIHMPPLKKCMRLMNTKFPGYFSEEFAGTASKPIFAKRSLEEYGRAPKRQKTEQEKTEKKNNGGKKKLSEGVEKVINSIPRYFQNKKQKISLSLGQ